MGLYIRIFSSTSQTLHVTQAGSGGTHTKLSYMSGGLSHSWWAISLAELKFTVLQRHLLLGTDVIKSSALVCEDAPILADLLSLSSSLPPSLPPSLSLLSLSPSLPLSLPLSICSATINFVSLQCLLLYYYIVPYPWELASNLNILNEKPYYSLLPAVGAWGFLSGVGVDFGGGLLDLSPPET